MAMLPSIPQERSYEMEFFLASRDASSRGRPFSPYRTTQRTLGAVAFARRPRTQTCAHRDGRDAANRDAVGNPKQLAQHHHRLSGKLGPRLQPTPRDWNLPLE